MIDKYAIGRAVERAADGKESFAVWPLDYPGCIAQGDSMPEAINQLLAILPGYLAARQARGVAVTTTTRAPSVSFAYATFNTGFGAIPDALLWQTGAAVA